jgi:hypothetical protein
MTCQAPNQRGMGYAADNAAHYLAKVDMNIILMDISMRLENHKICQGYEVSKTRNALF